MDDEAPKISLTPQIRHVERSEGYYSNDDADRIAREIGRWIVRKARRATFGEVVTVAINLFLAFVGIVAVFIYGGQLEEMKATSKVERDAVNLAKDNSHMDQRAWVTVSDIKPSSGKSDKRVLSLFFKNTGKTPAKQFLIRVAGEPVIKGRQHKSEETLMPGHGIIAPDGVFHTDLSGSFDGSTAVKLIIHGRIEYESIFGNSHWTKFCYYFIPNIGTPIKGGFAPCDSGNDIDDNPA